MALVLTIKKGDDFYIGDDRFVVSEVLSDVAFKIQGLGKEYLITDEKAVEVAPGVMVSAGIHSMRAMAKVAINAPRRIPIYRGDVYRGMQAEPYPVKAGPVGRRIVA
jgi:sRNA-binding carbon storage regulator CsrA